MSMTMEEENIKVAVRIRPMQTLERKEGDISCVKASEDGKEVQVKIGPLDASAYRCNQCFGNETSQIDFFKECGITELLDSAMKGYRSCAFAFGQTGAGKTFTMVGQPKVGAAVSHHNREKQNGLISRSLEYLFTKLEAAGVPFTIKMSCLEIYHEQVFDLSAEEKDRSPLAVREHAADGFFIEGSKLVECASYAAANAAFEAAARNRQTGSHDLNSRSSRSHCLTEIYIEIPVTVGADGGIGGGISHHSESGLDSGLTQGEYMSRGKISLVDLAGSERLKTTKSTGKVLQEAGFINKSLYVLGKVIAGLIRTNGDLNHKDVPYRDSKLTKLLISSLGGRSRTLLISCVSEAKSNMAETLRTLKFSMSCARIRNKPMKFLDPQEKLILDLKEEIKRLRNENKKLRSNLLTAPASGEKLGRMQSDDENNSVMSRAYSAHSSLEHERLQFKPRNGGKIYGTKMNSSQSDYIKKLSPIKKKRTGKAERKMTKKEALDMLDTMRAERMAKARAQAAGAPQGARGGIRQDYDDDVSSIGSASNYNQPRAAASEMDDLVRRRATGPMIFRGDSAKDLTPVREMAATYSPAQNNSRSMDALRIAELERRIARMETGVLAQPPQLYPHDHHAEAHSELTRYHTTMEASGAAAMPLEHMLGKDAVLAGQIARRNGAKKKSKAVKDDPTAWKGKQNSASPYIAHLVEKAPKANQERNLTSGEDHAAHIHRTAPTSQPQHQPQPQAAAKHYNEDSDSGRPPVKPKPAGRSSADNLRSAVAAGRKPAPVKTEETKGKGPAKDLHSSILDELAELGLDPLPAASAATAPAPKKKEKVEQKVTIKANDRDVRSHSRSRAPALANASTSNTKNPSLPSLPATESRSGKKQEAKKDLAPAGKAKILPPMMRERAKLTEAAAVLATPSKIASDPAALRMKLEALESSLIEERERMEDNPGEVTAETEEHYEELTKQARMLRKKLEMSGLDLSFQNDDVLDDSAPTPQAVRLMAQQMESLNKPFVRSTPAPTPAPAPAPAPVASPAPLSSEPRTSDLMFGRISRQASSVKQSLANAIAAAAEEEKNEDNDYADDDFEDDAKSKPGTASASARETSHIEAPAKMLQSKQFSRKFEELELNVPDVSRYIKPIPEKDSPKKQRRASITYASEEVFQVGTEEESASMRFSGLAAVHDALAFDSAEQPYARSPVNNTTAQFTPGAALTAPEREEVKATAASPAPSSKLNAPVATTKEPEADEYEEDTYEDEFADEDAETETKPVTIASAKAPVSAPVAAPVPVVSAFSPTPAATASVPSHYDTPILVSPSKDKFGNSSKSNKNYEDFSSPVAPAVKAASLASVKVSPVPKAMPASASPPEENNYDEDNYEDAYEEEFEADASTRLPAEINTANDATDEKHGNDEQNEQDEKDKKDEEESTFISTKSSPAFVPTLPLASESAKKAKQDVAITPSSAKVTAESTTFSSPSAKLSTKASPAKQASVSKKRAQTPGETEAAGDDYGDEDFDEYDVSFED